MRNFQNKKLTEKIVESSINSCQPLIIKYKTHPENSCGYKNGTLISLVRNDKRRRRQKRYKNIISCDEMTLRKQRRFIDEKVNRFTAQTFQLSTR